MFAIMSIFLLILYYILAGLGAIFILASILCLIFVGRKTKKQAGRKKKRHYIPFIILLFTDLLFITPLTYFVISDSVNRSVHDAEWKKNNPLDYAICKGNINDVIDLLDQGMDPNGKYEDREYSYFSIACTTVTDNSCEIIQIMLNYGATVNPDNDIPPLIYSVKKACNQRSYSTDRDTAQAEEQAYLAIIELLLKNDADPNGREPSIIGRTHTPLMYIALKPDENYVFSNIRYDIASLLLDYGADINAATEAGYTVLMYGSSKTSTSYYPCVSIECISFLLENGSDPSITNYGGETALDLAQAAYEEESENMPMEEKRMEEYKEIFDLLTY